MSNFSVVRKARNALGHPISLILIIWFIAVLSRLIRNGEVYGLNYLLFQPDGSLYQAFTLKLQGFSWSESASNVNAFYKDRIGVGYLGTTIDPVVQKVISGRPLLSILSLPFVALFGQYGMLAVPVLSYLLLGVVIYLIGKELNAEYFSVFLFLVISLSTSVNRWMVSNLTDGLLVGLIAVLALLLVKKGLGVYLLAIVALALLTRPSGPIVFALLFPFLFTAKRLWVALAMGLAIIGTLVLALYSPESTGTQTSGEYTVANRISDFLFHVIKVIVVEIGQLVVMDRILFIFLVASTGVALYTWRSTWSQSYLLVLVVAFAMGGWNGALGVNFRYQLPVIVPAVAVLLMNYSLLQSGMRKLLKIRSQN
jgi:hypothetical protein